jgi:hypothetical protein
MATMKEKEYGYQQKSMWQRQKGRHRAAKKYF